MPKKDSVLQKSALIQGAKDFKLGFELDRTFAHYDVFEGYRATGKYGDRGKASPSDGYKPPFEIRGFHVALFMRFFGCFLSVFFCVL